MFKRLKNFLKRIGAAFKELIFGTDADTQPKETTSYEEVEYDEKGEVKKIKKIEVVNTNPSFKDICKKLWNNIKQWTYDFVSDPLPKIRTIIAAFSVGGVISMMLNNIKQVQSITDRFHANRMEGRRIYDNRTMQWYTLKRRMTPKESKYMMLQRERGRFMGDILGELGLI